MQNVDSSAARKTVVRIRGNARPETRELKCLGRMVAAVAPGVAGEPRDEGDVLAAAREGMLQETAYRDAASSPAAAAGSTS